MVDHVCFFSQIFAANSTVHRLKFSLEIIEWKAQENMEFWIQIEKSSAGVAVAI